MGEHFRAFTFVDRIDSFEPGVSIRGRYAIPRGVDSFPSSLVAESIGQLAAWSAMAAGSFERRPVAGIAGGIEILSEVKPGQSLDLEAQIESLDEEAMSYGGVASVAGEPALRLEHCLGPMMPVEEFDDPESLRGHFDLLRGGGAEPGGFGGIPAFGYERTGGEAGQSAVASLKVPESAPFFEDHFPRRPVFPGTLLMKMNLELASELAAEISVSAGGKWHLDRVADVKLRAFIEPGEDLEVTATLRERSDEALTLQVRTRLGSGKPVSGARVMFSREEGE